MNAESRMSSELSVRLVTRQDYDRWLPLWDGYNAFYGRSGATALAPEITRMTWARFFDRYQPNRGLGADSGGRLLGPTHHRSGLLSAGSVHGRDRARQRGRHCGYRRSRDAVQAHRLTPRVLANPRDQ